MFVNAHTYVCTCVRVFVYLYVCVICAYTIRNNNIVFNPWHPGNLYAYVCMVVWFDIEAAEKKEIERKKSEEKATLRKLQKLIEKEQGRKNKKSKSRKSTR